jgi:murein DD-endopeptidase MepM/ murein hydrolase activator NlpD
MPQQSVRVPQESQMRTPKLVRRKGKEEKPLKHTRIPRNSPRPMSRPANRSFSAAFDTKRHDFRIFWPANHVHLAMRTASLETNASNPTERMRILEHIPSPEVSQRNLPALMLASALAAMLAVPGVSHDDDGLVALYLFARGPWIAPVERCLPTLPGDAALGWSDDECAPPADAHGAEFPSALVFRDGAAKTPAAAFTPEDIEQLAVRVANRLDPESRDGDLLTASADREEPGHTTHKVPLPFDPLNEPVFASSAPAAEALPPAAPAVLAKAEVAAPRAVPTPPAQMPAPPETTDRIAIAAEPPVARPSFDGQAIADRHAAAEYVNPAPGAEDFFAALPTLRGASHIREVSHRIRPGETISQVFKSAGVDRNKIPEWVQAAGRFYDLNRVYAGQQIALFVDSRDGSIEQMSIDVDRETVLVAARRNGQVVAQKQQVPHYRRLRVVGGEIDRSLYATAVSRGIPERVVSDVAEILGWELDFAKDLHRGATFRVVYEEIVRVDTTKAIAGRVLAIDINNRGRLHEGYYFKPNDDVRGGYFDRNGRALGRAFLRYPVAYSRISSHFSTARYHPIKKKNVPHYGVDFAAKPGTPVVASADVPVTKAGWQGGNGRLIKIRHDRIYESAYAHLAGIAAGVKAGTAVKRGQTIGYVGSSGMATGPHLHYAMYKRGKYVDPLKEELPKAQALTGAPLDRYLTGLALIDSAYAQAGLSDDVIASVADAAPSR